MKKTNSYLVLVFLAFMGFGFSTIESSRVANSTYQISKEKSIVNWTGKKLVGYSHHGTINFSKGTVVFQNDAPVSADFEVDMNTIKEVKEEDLTKHLKSEDFFNTAKFPTAGLKVTRIAPIKDNPDAGENNYMLSGVLTIKGISKNIAFPAAIKRNGKELTAVSKFKIDRSKYDVKFGSGSFFDDLGDDIISDEIELEVKVAATEVKMAATEATKK